MGLAPDRGLQGISCGVLCGNFIGGFLLEAIKAKLEYANKLIFVKAYDAAKTQIEELLFAREVSAELLVHLRYIELCTKLKILPEAVQKYTAVAGKKGKEHIADVCLAFCAQQDETLTVPESVARFQQISKDYGPSAASFYGIAYSLEIQGNHDRAIYNYEQSLMLDPDWYPSYFGLSQIFYQKQDNTKGDHYFYLFEKAAPFNVYGNFETHRKLSKEFLAIEQYEFAETAIKTLGEWWIENKGHCPSEIQIYEKLVTADVARFRRQLNLTEALRAEAIEMANNVLDRESSEEGVLFFIAKTLEEYSEFETAFKYYKRLLKVAGENPQVVQKIGAQFLSLGEYKLAKELFEDAAEHHPDNAEIRFCVLVSKLRLAGVNVEEYLIGKERLKQLLSNEVDKVEVLSLCHSLLAKFQEDPEVHHQMGNLYLHMGNVDRAEKHYRTMYRLDSRSKVTTLKYVAFLMHHGDAGAGLELLNQGMDKETLTREQQIEISWLKSNYHFRNKNHQASQDELTKVLSSDPWNVSYIVKEIVNLSHLAKINEEIPATDAVLLKLENMDEAELDWTEFDEQTAKWEALHQYSIAYARRKLRYLYSNGSGEALKALIKTACVFDATRGTFDFIRLLNTNFDTPAIYWALGILYKELWQLVVAAMWFEQTIMHPKITETDKARAYLELADCYLWLNQNLPKATEYAKLAIELGEKNAVFANNVMAHAHLKNGQIRQAEIFLENDNETQEFETMFLKGLLQYRNGAKKKANDIWKPLLTEKAETVRIHSMKQEILRFYFDGEPYLKDLKVN
jgi:tetratricopeptide (TPR) repeat protein